MSAQLRGRGYDEFAPTLKTDRKWTDRVKALDEFLFPGYVFCRFDPNNRFPVVSVRGVVHVVGFGDGPVAIPELEIQRVRKMVESGLLVQPWPFLKVGEQVRIEKGPLTGIEGLLESVKGKHRLVVSINLLQRSVSTEIERAWVSPMRSNPRSPNLKSKDTPGSSLVLPKQNIIRS